MKAPFPYPGGKSRVASLCWQAFGTDVKRYIESFCGSAAVLLARPRWPDNAVEIVNDADGCLVNAWQGLG
jgi:site-specific DNA-adenine methylase